MANPGPQPASWPWHKEIFLHLQLVPWIMLEDSLDTADSLAEALQLLPRFVAHRPEKQRGAGKWKGLSLKSAGGQAEKTSLPVAPQEFSLTEIAALCPATMKLLESLTDISQCERVRFMLLEPGAEIVVHSDSPDKPTSLALNIALNMPAGCDFWADLEPEGGIDSYSRKIPIRAGSAFLFNSSTYHRVVNNSAEPRIHLIAHGPLRYSDDTLLTKSRAQNKTRDIRHLTNLLMRKKLEKGIKVAESDSLYCDFYNFGANFDFLPPGMRIALVTEDLPDPSLAREAYLISAAGLNNIPHEIIPRSGLHEWLYRQATQGGTHAALLAAGTQIHDPTTFVTELVKEFTTLRKTNAALGGHLIHRVGELPYLHEQFVLLDLKAWQTCDRPDFHDLTKRPFPAFLPSSQCVHDNYTPLWIEPAPGGEIIQTPRFGTQALAAFLRAGRAVRNLSGELRAQKDFMYPREGRGHDYQRVRGRIDRYLREKAEKVYVYNTETMPIEDYPFQPSVLISPCAGFKPFALLKQFALHSGNARFLFLEKNQNALEYYRSLLSCTSMAEVYSLQESTLAKQGFLPAEGGRAYVKKMTSAVLTELYQGSQAEFLASLREMNSAAHFEQVCYLNEPEKIENLIQPGDRVLFWHSNVWEYTAAFYERSAEDLRENYLALVGRIAKKCGLPALIHQESYKAVLGEDFQSPRIVLTAGGSKLGKPSRSSFRPITQIHV